MLVKLGCLKLGYLTKMANEWKNTQLAKLHSRVLQLDCLKTHFQLKVSFELHTLSYVKQNPSIITKLGIFWLQQTQSKNHLHLDGHLPVFNCGWLNCLVANYLVLDICIYLYSYNQFHNISGLFDVLPYSSFTASEMIGDYYL